MKDIAGWPRTCSLAALILAGAAGCGGEADSPETQLPSHVHVSIIDVTTGVGKTDGTQWDGPGDVPEDLFNSVAGLLARRNPYVAIGSVFASLSAGLFEKPDPTGRAELLNGANPVSRVDLKSSQQDTFTPQWQDAQGKAPTFVRVPLNASTRIRVQLVDDDQPLPDDPMGVCELNDQDLVAALQARNVHHVNVAEQTNNRILFVGISVIPD